ncbi:acyltransferase family protein [Herbiconiux sp. KACC 21604]|uniref:acyltransferase family protein n=1 Tax=unclassified Herbiconiux TaxID=2618217 RepID=UPI001490E25D|nr:acyltransferase family protein [Herbiconiux sp. SALV-R1]QJU55366.1 acyltransferase [Herbiconiux sp. SALV-R1]WPO86537.1 acyltransferase family protein [Herbiconiux sp. KACC 21604]
MEKQQGARAADKGARPDHFLPHLQGLRAIAVLLVVVYHFWPGRLTGGYIGVDVFFVISGFLITQQLTRQLERTDRIALPSFYAKRARRLLPAAITVLVFASLMTLFVMPLSSLTENVREILASTFYVENWVLALNSVDYLAAANEASLVQHYWSLSLEEQFYLFWPVLLLGASVFAVKFLKGRRWLALISVLAIVGVVSFALSVVVTITDPAAAYFVTYTRVWEFAVGGALALLPRLRPVRAWQSNLLGYGGIVVVLACGYLFDKTTPFPGYMAAIPVLGTAAVIVAHHREKPWDVGRVLSFRPVSFIGDISYSLYLWHWPLIVIAPYIPGWGLSIWNRIALFLFCFVIAWATKRFIEDPARTWTFFTKRRPRTTMLAVVGAMLVSTLFAGTAWAVQQPKYDAEAAQLASTLTDPPECFGAASGPTDGLEPIVPQCDNPELADVIIPSPGFGNADRPQHPECLSTLNDATVRDCQFGSDDADAPQIALIGDSHAYALMDPFIEMAERNGWHLTTYLKGGCPWTTTPLAARDAFAISCDDWRADLTAQLGAHEPFDAVFTAALTDRNVPGTSDDEQVAAVGYGEAWAQVLDAGTPIVTVVDNPAWPDDPNKCLRTEDAASCTVPRDEGLAEFDPIAMAADAAVAQGADVTLLDFSDTYCTSEECPAVVGGANVYRDVDHLTRTFAFTLEPFLERAMLTALGR